MTPEGMTSEDAHLTRLRAGIKSGPRVTEVQQVSKGKGKEGEMVNACWCGHEKADHQKRIGKTGTYELAEQAARVARLVQLREQIRTERAVLFGAAQPWIELNGHCVNVDFDYETDANGQHHGGPTLQNATCPCGETHLSFERGDIEQLVCSNCDATYPLMGGR